MALFLSINIHQGDELFSVLSRGKQCAFMSLSAILAAENNPLINWSKSTLNNVLLEGDKMYLKALDDGLINLDPGVELLSVDTLQTLVNVSCDKNMFSYEICRSVVSPAVHAKTMATNSDLSFVVDSPEPEALKYIDLPIVAQPFEAQNNIDQPIVVEPIVDQPIVQP